MMNWQAQTRADYGADIITPGRAADAAHALDRALDRAIDRTYRRTHEPSSVAEYVRWARDAARAWGGDSTDGRLIGVCYGTMPAHAWSHPYTDADRSGPQRWLDYWRATQPRPSRVGSSHNDNPRYVYMAFRAGIPAPHYPHRLAHLLMQGRTGKRRVRAVCRLAHTFRGHVSLPGDLPTADLVRLTRMPQSTLRAVAGDIMIPCVYEGDKPHVDWHQIAQAVRALATVPRAVLRTCRVPSWAWMQWLKLDGKAQAAFRNVATILNVTAKHWSASLLLKKQRYTIPKPYYYTGSDYSAMVTLAKAGLLAKIASLYSPDSPAMLYLIAIVNEGLDLPPIEILHSPALIREWYESQSGTYETATPATTRTVATWRAHDRLAQRSPTWAIAQRPDEYTRGQRISAIMCAAVQWLHRTMLATTAPVVIHGRDCEILYHLAMRGRIVRFSRSMRKRLRYVISSRPITTHRPANATWVADHTAYLRRLCAPGAIHIDTGFAGSIPRWINANIASIGEIRLISADDPSRAIPIADDLIPAGGLRELVLSDLEHSSQRLERPNAWGIGQRTYSQGAPGYWARLYGIEAGPTGARQPRYLP